MCLDYIEPNSAQPNAKGTAWKVVVVNDIGEFRGVYYGCYQHFDIWYDRLEIYQSTHICSRLDMSSGFHLFTNKSGAERLLQYIQDCGMPNVEIIEVEYEDIFYTGYYTVAYKFEECIVVRKMKGKRLNTPVIQLDT